MNIIVYLLFKIYKQIREMFLETWYSSFIATIEYKKKMSERRLQL